MMTTFIPALWCVAVDRSGLHGLICAVSLLVITTVSYRSINKALPTSHIPSRLEPTCLDRSEGKHHDGPMEEWKPFGLGCSLL